MAAVPDWFVILIDGQVGRRLAGPLTWAEAADLRDDLADARVLTDGVAMVVDPQLVRAELARRRRLGGGGCR